MYLKISGKLLKTLDSVSWWKLPVGCRNRSRSGIQVFQSCRRAFLMMKISLTNCRDHVISDKTHKNQARRKFF